MTDGRTTASFVRRYPCNLFGSLGLVVLLLTMAIAEPKLQKVCFIIVGIAGTVAFIILNSFKLLSWLGHQPGGDGGGIIVPMLIVVCPPLFLIGAVGAIVCLIKGGIGKNSNQP